MNGIANNEDPDQTAPLGARSSLIRVFTVCPNVSVQNFWIFTVFTCRCMTSFQDTSSDSLSIVSLTVIVPVPLLMSKYLEPFIME